LQGEAPKVLCLMRVPKAAQVIDHPFK
jgi:hypothetical protein